MGIWDLVVSAWGVGGIPNLQLLLEGALEDAVAMRDTAAAYHEEVQSPHPGLVEGSRAVPRNDQIVLCI